MTGGSANTFSDGYIIEVTKNNDGTFEGHEIYLDDSIVFMGIDANGYIYIADELGSRIIQCHITEDDPTKIERTKVWVNEQATFPNGITIKEDTLYFTELLSGNVKKVTIGESGAPESVQTIYNRPGAILDYLTIYKEGVIITSCIDGVIFYLTDPDIPCEKGKVVFETPLETFIIPTSVSIGRPQMFQNEDIIVTEGSYLPLYSGGWRVSLVKEICQFLD